MTKAVILTLLFTALSCGCSGLLNPHPDLLGSAVAVTQTREVGGFDRIHISGVFDTTIRIGPKYVVSITIDDNLIHLLKTQVDDGELQVFTSGSFGTTIGIKVDIVTPSLIALTKKGLGSLEVLEFSGEELKITQAGIGDVSVQGSVAALHASNSGIGDLDLAELIARAAWVSTEGIGDIKIHATHRVDAASHGIGSITIHGNPRNRAISSGNPDKIIFD